MDTFSILDLFSLLCGLALFLYGMQQGEKNLRHLGGTDVKKVINLITRHRLSAYVAGFTTTIITQSSSATTVMLVGLASAKLMSFGQSLGMILGSDLGTTLTVQLFAFNFHQFSPILIAVGFFSSVSIKSEKVADYGNLVLAFGFIFFGMSLMAQAVTPLRSLPFFEYLLRESFLNPWWGLLTGTLFTAIIQSSAATLAILITLVASFEGSGWMPGSADILPLVLGANLGTCATALISTFSAEPEGVRVAWAHFFFKFIGAAAIFPLYWVLKAADISIGGSPAFQVAAMHTFFNIFISVLFLPFLRPFEKFILSLIKNDSALNPKYQLKHIHQKVLTLPSLALSLSENEISRMGKRVTDMCHNCRNLVKGYNTKLFNAISEQDNEVDFLHENIVTFLTRISHKELSTNEATKAYQLIMITTDLEHIGDIISKRIIELAAKIKSSPIPLSDEGKEEISKFFDETTTLLVNVFTAFAENDKNLACHIFNQKHKIRSQFNKYVEHHMKRLYQRKPESLQTTSIHVDLLEEIQRINHFSFRIAAHILEIHRAE
ncbi:Na/Pi cotransporter family protein [Chitinispirillales bacterium ANBcel5]|uniref:Na/Pi cotransporter family protein n=1 Tax=Cellulosispirillum alkaliphilum TaxID=3039283 RepID=UPI002A54B1B6|nr:Na/Pi cotransporter family protein [Chitinispirillales bacterium ANBcel5]